MYLPFMRRHGRSEENKQVIKRVETIVCSVYSFEKVNGAGI